jgi:plastocyanin
MRPQRLLIPLALLTPLVLASPAAALDWRVDATNNFTFEPAELQIAVGDSVTWHFLVDGHTSKSLRGQPESWNSASDGTNPAGSTYPKVFDTPGRYQYVCTPHQSFMKGEIQVGTDTVTDTLDNFRTRRRGNRVTLSFLLNEPAKVTYRLKGPSPRTVRRGRLDDGARSFTVRRLRRGSYRGVLTVVDDFDKGIRRRNSFVIR